MRYYAKGGLEISRTGWFRLIENGRYCTVACNEIAGVRILTHWHGVGDEGDEKPLIFSVSVRELSDGSGIGEEVSRFHCITVSEALDIHYREYRKVMKPHLKNGWMSFDDPLPEVGSIVLLTDCGRNFSVAETLIQNVDEDWKRIFKYIGSSERDDSYDNFWRVIPPLTD